MDETLQDLENELKRLTPRRPSVTLTDALADELGAPASGTQVRSRPTNTSGQVWRWASWSLAAAAVIAFGVLFQIARRSTTPVVQAPVEVTSAGPAGAASPAVVATNRYDPVQATSVLYDLKEDGAATLADQTEGRQVRYRYVDTYTWKNPATNASLRWSVPRDEVRIIRASLD